MKTFLLITTLCLIHLIKSFSQGELSILEGIHPSSAIYDGASGTHTALQYNIVTSHDISYGIIAQHSRFAIAHSGITPKVSSLNGFASYPLFENRRIKPYVKMEFGASSATVAQNLEARASSPDSKPVNFISAQIVPAIGSQISLTKSLVMQMEYKKTIHYANALVANGEYNYGTFDIGVTYKFSGSRNRNNSYARSLPRCSYKKGGVSSCFSFQ